MYSMQLERYCFLALAVLLCTAAVFTYMPGLNGPFVFDDMPNILQATSIRISDLSFDSLRQAWQAREFDTFIGRPLAMVSFALNYYFAEFDVFYYKLTNLFVHLVTGASLYWLSLIILKRYRVANRECLYQARHLPWLALAISGIWLLHPLNLTSVLYVVQRMTSLSTLFVVLGLIGYCYGREQILQGRKVGLVTILASFVVFGSLAMMCKENGALLLPLAAVLELTFYRFAAEKKIAPLFRRFWLVVVVLPMVLVLSAVLVQHDRWFGDYAYHRRDFTLYERLLTQTRVLWFYLRLILFPDIAEMGLYHDDLSLSRGLIEPTSTLFSLIGVVGLVVTAIFTRRRAPILFFAICWFLVGHSMESSIFPLELIHEHRNYMPQYGVLFGFVYYVGAPFSKKKLRTTLRIRLTFLVLFGVLLGIGTFSRSLQWQDEYSLYSREIINHPESPRAHTMMGAWMHNHGMPRQAQQHLITATNLTPRQAEHLSRLVQNVYMTSRHVPDELMDELRYRLTHTRTSSITLWVYEPLLLVSRNDPKYHDLFLELFSALLSRPDIDYGEKSYEAAYRLIGDSHAHRGRNRVAMQYYEKARSIQARPYYDVTYAVLYVNSGCHDKARDIISRLQAQKPKLSSNDESRLRDVEEALTLQEDSPTRCTL
jgi:hypothetical protein